MPIYLIQYQKEVSASVMISAAARGFRLQSTPQVHEGARIIDDVIFTERGTHERMDIGKVSGMDVAG
jgi:hypothetical protein